MRRKNKLPKSTHQLIAEKLREVADLMDALSMEVTTRKRYPSHDYISSAKRLGIGEHHYDEVALTRFELVCVRRELAERRELSESLLLSPRRMRDIELREARAAVAVLQTSLTERIDK